MSRRKANFWRRFWEDDDGSYTVEMVIWSPLILTSLVLVLEIGYLMTINASMWSASRDTARAVSIHRVRPDEAAEYLRGRLFIPHDDYAIEVDVNASEVLARVSLSSERAALTPIIGRYISGEIKAQVSMLREPE